MRGIVGLSDDAGCTVVVRTADRSGNACESGGAALQCTCTSAGRRVRDERPQRRLLPVPLAVQGVGLVRGERDDWRRARDWLAVRHQAALDDARPEPHRIDGRRRPHEGDRRQARDHPAVRLVDEFCNPATPGDKFRFGIALVYPSGTEQLPKKEKEGKEGSEHQKVVSQHKIDALQQTLRCVPVRWFGH
jgi:hypothetical protein